MTETANQRSPRKRHPEVPLFELGVRGPRGEGGFLIQADFPEAVVWDIENEIVSARREWLSSEEGWWIAASYFDTALDIVLRFFPHVRVRYPDTGEERMLDAG